MRPSVDQCCVGHWWSERVSEWVSERVSEWVSEWVSERKRVSDWKRRVLHEIYLLLMTRHCHMRFWFTLYWADCIFYFCTNLWGYRGVGVWRHQCAAGGGDVITRQLTRKDTESCVVAIVVGIIILLTCAIITVICLGLSVVLSGWFLHLLYCMSVCSIVTCASHTSNHAEYI